MKHVKCVFISDDEVNKRSLLRPLTGYDPEFDPTSTNVMAEGLPPVNLQIWASKTEEQNAKLRPLSYPQTDIFVFVFSLVNPKSLESIENTHIKEVEEFCPGKPKLLVGIESELRDDFESKAEELRAKGFEPIPASKGEEVAKKIGAKEYIEISVPTSTHLSDLLDKAVTYAEYPDKIPEEKKGKYKDSKGCEIF